MSLFTRKSGKGSTATAPKYVFAASLLQNCNKIETRINVHYVYIRVASYPHISARFLPILAFKTKRKAALLRAGKQHGNHANVKNAQLVAENYMKNKACHFFALALLIASIFGVTACESYKGEAKYPTGMDRTTTGGDIYGERESLFGSSGLSLLGGKNKGKNDGSTGIGVNSYLWRASLDTVSFMPLASADPFGGVIITDWYIAQEKPNERFKVNIFILDKQLRSDGVKVKVFRQVKKGGNWVDSTVADNTGPQMEDAILTRARQLRVDGMGEE